MHGHVCKKVYKANQDGFLNLDHHCKVGKLHVRDVTDVRIQHFKSWDNSAKLAQAIFLGVALTS